MSAVQSLSLCPYSAYFLHQQTFEQCVQMRFWGCSISSRWTNLTIYVSSYSLVEWEDYGVSNFAWNIDRAGNYFLFQHDYVRCLTVPRLYECLFYTFEIKPFLQVVFELFHVINIRTASSGWGLCSSWTLEYITRFPAREEICRHLAVASEFSWLICGCCFQWPSRNFQLSLQFHSRLQMDSFLFLFSCRNLFHDICWNFRLWMFPCLWLS